MTQRIRGHRLQRVRRYVLDAQPLCVHCMQYGRVTLATQVDHIVPLHEGGEECDDNRQPLCHDCHRIKSSIEAGKQPRMQVGPDGYPRGVS